VTGGRVNYLVAWTQETLAGLDSDINVRLIGDFVWLPSLVR
jgi:hypothetical protein